VSRVTEKAAVAVVGAGAAGLAAAIFAAEGAPGAGGVVVLDGAPRIGAKILIAGGGRCNVTHDAVRAEDFNGSRPVVRNVLAAFGAEAAVRWFAGLGVELKREATGKLFPVTDRASTVLEALLGRCRALGVEVLAAHRVEGITAVDGGGFAIAHARGVRHAERVVLAAGGRSVPKTGSDGSGYELARALGHTVTETFPALVPLVLAPGPFDFAALSGTSHEAELTTRVPGKVLDRRTGSLLWTHFGVSGPVAMDASRHWVGARLAGAAAELICSFLPGLGAEPAEAWIDAAAAARPQRTVAALVAERLPERVGAAIAAACGLPPDLRLANFSRDRRRALARGLTSFPLPVLRDRGWNYAEVTAGGVPLDEIDFRTMESRRAPGLHLAGEILDCDGRIGGFNFQWAWATGFLAGTAAARPLSAPTSRRPPSGAS
jgi:predicted Rossmann fold flavoprotein